MPHLTHRYLTIRDWKHGHVIIVMRVQSSSPANWCDSTDSRVEEDEHSNSFVAPFLKLKILKEVGKFLNVLP